MVNLALWLKQNRFKPDQVQNFYPSPMALATAMYYSGKNPLKKVTYKSEQVTVNKEIDERRVQKAFLRYHDEKNWPMLREALEQMGRSDLIGHGPEHLIPPVVSRPGHRLNTGGQHSVSASPGRPSASRPKQQSRPNRKGRSRPPTKR